MWHSCYQFANDSLHQGSDESTIVYLHKAQDILECIHHTSNMSSITTIGTNHANILTGLKDSRMQNELAKSKAKKWTTRAHVLQDVADMAVDFKRSCWYSLPMFKVQYVSSTNSNSSYRSNKPTTKSTQQPSAQTGKAQMLALPGRTLQKGLPNSPQGKFPLKIQIHKGKNSIT